MRELLDNIILSAKAQKLNSYSLAALSGVSQPTTSRILSGKSCNPDSKTIKKLADALKIAVIGENMAEENVRFTDGIKSVRQESKKELPAEGTQSFPPLPVPEDLIGQFVPDGGELTEIYYLAGAGEPRLQTDEVVTTMVLPSDFIHPNIIPVMVKGSSMEPAMYNGAIAGVDISEKDVVSGKFYAIWIDDEGALIKRLSREIGRVFIESLNPVAHSFYVNNEALQEHFILGRVKWWINKDME